MVVKPKAEAKATVVKPKAEVDTARSKKKNQRNSLSACVEMKVRIPQGVDPEKQQLEEALSCLQNSLVDPPLRMTMRLFPLRSAFL